MKLNGVRIEIFEYDDDEFITNYGFRIYGLDDEPEPLEAVSYKSEAHARERAEITVRFYLLSGD